MLSLIREIGIFSILIPITLIVVTIFIVILINFFIWGLDFIDRILFKIKK